MATHKSAEKRARQTVGRTARNNATKSSLRTFERHVRTAAEGKDAKATGEALKLAISQLDKAASKGIIHAKKAARKAARLSKLLAANNA